MAAAAGKVSVTKRDPVMIGGAIIGILESIVFYAGEAGLELPLWVTAILAVIVAAAGAFGIRATTRPAALSVPATLAVAAAARDAKTTIKGKPNPLVVSATQIDPVHAAADKAKSALQRPGNLR